MIKSSILEAKTLIKSIDNGIAELIGSIDQKTIAVDRVKDIKARIVILGYYS